MSVRHEPFVARGERAAVDRRGEGLAADGNHRRIAVHDVRDEGTGSTLQALQRYGLVEVREETEVRACGRGSRTSGLARYGAS
ncbi:hypothetical protein STENM223S_03125 [Streptomyces tendae]